MDPRKLFHEPSIMSRRRWLQAALFGSGMIGLRAAASGIPAQILAAPERTLLSMTDEVAYRQANAVRAQYLIISVSDSGEPMNCNTPGTYLDPQIRHPTDPTMAGAPLQLGDTVSQAAAVWNTLPPAALARSSFFHHGTYSISHGELPSVFSLKGLVPKREQYFSAIAKPLAQMLGTIQSQPVDISGIVNGLTYEGVQQPVFKPTGIKNFLSAPAALSALNSATSLRDRDVDALYAMLKTSGTKAQRNLLDAWSNSQAAARKLSGDVVAKLGSLVDDSQTSQVTCAALLCALKLAPVFLVTMGFGGDNHTDNDPHQGKGRLPTEQGQHVASLASINSLVSTLGSLGLSDDVTFATLTTFGRTNCDEGYTGRTHNPTHSCNLIMGKNVRGSVIGGVKLVGKTLLASSIDSRTGQGVDGGDIPYSSTLGSFAATLGASLGLEPDQLTELVGSNQTVAAALA